MPKKKPDIHSLLAARIRTTRRSPLQRHGQRPAGALRLTHEDSSAAAASSRAPAPPSHPEGAIDRLLAASDLLERADAAWGRVGERISVFRSCWIGGQGHALAATIDRAMHDALHNGVNVLDGACEIDLTDLIASPADRFRFPRLDISRLGRPGVGSIEDLLRGDGSIESALEILSGAIDMAVRHRSGIREWLDRVRSELCAQRVALENIHAARQSANDPDFAIAASRIGHVDVLAASRGTVQGAGRSHRPNLRCVHEPAGEEASDDPVHRDRNGTSAESNVSAMDRAGRTIDRRSRALNPGIDRKNN